jgi:putative colanic acid biosynthesis acetyltransferase WcaB
MTWRQWVLQDWAANAGYPDSRLILAAYRFTQLTRTQWGPLGGLIFAVYWIVVARVVGVELSPSTRIGPGLRMPHPNGIVLNPGVTMGAGCLLRHNVTIGNLTRRDGSDKGIASVGDDVEFGAGCVVVGDIHVGDHARIGALSLVTQDVPAWGVMLGNPAKLVRIDEPGGPGQTEPHRSGQTEPGGSAQVESDAGVRITGRAS